VRREAEAADLTVAVRPMAADHLAADILLRAATGIAENHDSSLKPLRPA
jgi:hypothetical protein